jgi:hypothetical protein
MANVKLTRVQIKLVDEAANLAAVAKATELRLKEIKAELKVLPKGTYTTAKSVLVVNTRDNYTDPTPAELLAVLKKMKMKDRFTDCVSILVTETKKIMGEETFNKLRVFVDKSSVFSFKVASTEEV